jgi:uridine kinase
MKTNEPDRNVSFTESVIRDRQHACIILRIDRDCYEYRMHNDSQFSKRSAQSETLSWRDLVSPKNKTYIHNKRYSDDAMIHIAVASLN